MQDPHDDALVHDGNIDAVRDLMESRADAVRAVASALLATPSARELLARLVRIDGELTRALEVPSVPTVLTISARSTDVPVGPTDESDPPLTGVDVPVAMFRSAAVREPLAEVEAREIFETDRSDAADGGGVSGDGGDVVVQNSDGSTTITFGEGSVIEGSPPSTGPGDVAPSGSAAAEAGGVPATGQAGGASSAPEEPAGKPEYYPPVVEETTGVEVGVSSQFPFITFSVKKEIKEIHRPKLNQVQTIDGGE